MKKVYIRRDSAVTVLRKIGIAKTNYDKFIHKTDDGQYACDVGKAEASLKHTEATKVGRRTNDPVVENPTKAKHGSVAHFTRELIRAGKTNDEIWVLLQESFGLDTNKRHYPQWYRAEMKRKGESV